MGRKSKLTDEQWAEIGKRLLEGESISALGREFGVGESTIRSRFERRGQSTKTIQQVASEIFNADAAKEAAERHLRELPVAAQYAAITLAAKMRSVSDSLASAADNSAKTAHLLSALANTQAQKIDDADPMQSVEQIKSTVLLTKAANEAAHIPVNLLAANRDMVKRLNEEGAPAEDDDVMTPERKLDAARRMAFILAEAKHTMENT